MTKIICPNKNYMGLSATVEFDRGVGYTDNPTLIQWFKAHGYTVEEPEEPEAPEAPEEPEAPEAPEEPEEPEAPEEPEEPSNTWTVEELIEYAKEHDIDIGKATTKRGILVKLRG